MNMGAVVASVTWIGFVPWTRLRRQRELEAQVQVQAQPQAQPQAQQVAGRSEAGGAGEEPTSTP